MSELINLLTLVFASSAFLILIMDRLNHPILPAYILGGILIGGYLPEEQFLNLSQLGIAFLVFIFGLKADLSRIKVTAFETTTTTLVQVALAGASMFVIAQGFGFNALNSLYLAAAAGFSSSMVGLELIDGEIRADLLHGRLAESIQLMQDLVAVALIAVIGSSLTLNSLAMNFLELTGMIALAVIFRQIVFDKVAALAEGSEELLMLSSLTLLTVFISVSQLLELSIVTGAFAAGLAVAKFPHNLEILDSVGSLKDFFSAIFFVSLGALIAYPEPTAIALTLILLIGTLIIKPVITSLLLMTNGYDKRTSYLAGFSLDQVSEFSLIIAIQAYIAGTIAPEIFHAITLAATVTMIISSYTSRYEEEIYEAVSKNDWIEVNSRKIKEKSDVPSDMKEHVILVGYDIQGKEIAEKLEIEGQDYVIIENDPEKISQISKEDKNYTFGDVMDDETWKTAKIDEASLIISTVPSTKISKHISQLETDADIIVNSSEIDEAKELLEAGAMYVSLAEVLSSEELNEHINGVLHDQNYREELRRKNILEIRQQLQNSDS
ncbi:cation:proton antiporter [Candidatus Nanohalococcus occultus]|uniref:cation:proton antiporter domain-containing protein n=1 Tax=Candidatus Nanohalococcus occultus TaxID=2978047 RepID=UPI0039E1F925